MKIKFTVDEYATILAALNEVRFRHSESKPQSAEHAAQIRAAVKRLDAIINKIDDVLLDDAD